MPHHNQERDLELRAALLSHLAALVLGTACAFLVSLLLPLMTSPLRAYLLYPYPAHSFLQAIITILSLVAIAILVGLPHKIWRSLKLRVMPVSSCVWGLGIAAAWISAERSFYSIAEVAILSSLLISIGVYLISKPHKDKDPDGDFQTIYSDLPLPENGEDLLGLQGMVTNVVSSILLEKPAIMAIMGQYGDGKTSFLNLVIGELKKSKDIPVPIIVRFSPWLAGDSNTLVRSLLNSIVSEVRSSFVVPGLGADAARYARVLLSTVPWTERLKEMVSESSQEARIDALISRIAKIRRRLLVVLDDLDRMEAEELETILKLLRGSDKLSNVTFMCAFCEVEVASILKKTRPHQNTSAFIEKFFPVVRYLPKIESEALLVFFSRGVADLLQRHSLPEIGRENIEKIWQQGANKRLANLRRIKLFLNKISGSLTLVGHEVNIEDLIRLDLIRDIQPDLYEQIYRDRSKFWDRSITVETRLEEPYRSDQEIKKERVDFYDKLKASLAEREDVLSLLNDLFPNLSPQLPLFASRSVDPDEAERTKRIFHPRCFRQYFVPKVPSELFPRKEFEKFCSSVKNLEEEGAADLFSQRYRAIVHEEFKSWHFMNLIDLDFDGFESKTMRGLCRGMARNSFPWPTDDFRSLIAARSTLAALTNNLQ